VGGEKLHQYDTASKGGKRYNRSIRVGGELGASRGSRNRGGGGKKVGGNKDPVPLKGCVASDRGEWRRVN